MPIFEILTGDQLENDEDTPCLNFRHKIEIYRHMEIIKNLDELLNKLKLIMDSSINYKKIQFVDHNWTFSIPKYLFFPKPSPDSVIVVGRS